MKARGPALVVIGVLGLLVPALLLSAVFATPAAPAAIDHAADRLWLYGLEQYLTAGGFHADSVQILGTAQARTLAVTVDEQRSDHHSPTSYLIERIHWAIGEALTELPFAPNGLATVTVWILAAEGPNYSVSLPAGALSAWADYQISFDEYASTWSADQAAPGDVWP